MDLHTLIHAPTRHSWTARLVAYIACVVTLCALFEVINAIFFS